MLGNYFVALGTLSVYRGQKIFRHFCGVFYFYCLTIKNVKITKILLGQVTQHQQYYLSIEADGTRAVICK